MKSPSCIFIQLFLLLILITNCQTNTAPNQESIKANQKALSYLNDGDYSNAIKHFKLALNAQPIDLETHQIILRNIAISYYDSDQVDSSIFYFQKAIDISPKNTYDYYVNQADVDLLVNRVDDAITNLKRARSISPDELEVNNTLGLIFLGEYGDKYIDYDRALTYNIKVAEISNDRATATVLARNYYYLKKYEKAELLFTELNKKYPSLLDYQYWLGVTKYGKGEIDVAKEILTDLISKDSSYSNVLSDILD